MKPTCPQKLHREEGNSPLVVVIILVVIAALAYYLHSNNLIPGVSMPTATPEARINPEPQSPYQVSVSEVSPGSKVVVDSVSASEDVYVVVVKDGKTQTVVGKSALLTTGTHTNVEVALTSAIKDGDVIYIRLQNKQGKTIQNDQKVNIEVMKNVGMLMTHYDSEY